MWTLGIRGQNDPLRLSLPFLGVYYCFSKELAREINRLPSWSLKWKGLL